jgi:hypothetical protein
MLRKALKKIFRPWSKRASDKMTAERARDQEQAEELTPGHADRAGQIGVFH